MVLRKRFAWPASWQAWLAGAGREYAARIGAVLRTNGACRQSVAVAAGVGAAADEGFAHVGYNKMHSSATKTEPNS